MEIDDISEIREGCHSFGFVRTNSFELDDVGLSIISTGWVFDLQVTDKVTRDLLVNRLHKFIMVLRRRSETENTAFAEEQM